MRQLLATVALLGLFAMHGLSDHGTSEHLGMVGDEQAMAHAQPAVAAAEMPAGHSDMGAVGLCLAVLVAAVLGFAAVRLRLLSSWLPWSSYRDRRWAVVAGRDRDPPDLVHLSIQRC
jgi:hypothetical protein